MSHGVILFAHGSRDPAWHAPIEAVAARMRALAPARTPAPRTAAMTAIRRKLLNLTTALLDTGSTRPARALPPVETQAPYVRSQA